MYEPHRPVLTLVNEIKTATVRAYPYPPFLILENRIYSRITQRLQVIQPSCVMIYPITIHIIG